MRNNKDPDVVLIRPGPQEEFNFGSSGKRPDVMF